MPSACPRPPCATRIAGHAARVDAPLVDSPGGPHRQGWGTRCSAAENLAEQCGISKDECSMHFQPAGLEKRLTRPGAFSPRWRPWRSKERQGFSSEHGRHALMPTRGHLRTAGLVKKTALVGRQRVGHSDSAGALSSPAKRLSQTWLTPLATPGRFHFSVDPTIMSIEQCQQLVASWSATTWQSATSIALRSTRHSRQYLSCEKELGPSSKTSERRRDRTGHLRGQRARIIAHLVRTG